LENTDNRFTKSYKNLGCGLLPFNPIIVVKISIRSFDLFGTPSKQRLFLMDSFKWAPRGFAAWIFGVNRSPGMVRLRENKKYGHEVALKLIEEKKQELKDGISRRDVLSLLGASRPLSIKFNTWYDFHSSVKSNSALREDWRLKDEEIVAQVR
jgi:hypothetical protein